MNILYIGNTNSCRSILSEAITNRIADGRIIARSAGIAHQPTADLLTLYQLIQHGYDIENLYSKHVDQITDFTPNIVITLCETAAKQNYAQFANALRFHWNTEDPSRMQCTDSEIDRAFGHTMSTIEKRVNMMLDLPLHTLKEDPLPNTLLPNMQQTTPGL